MSYTITITQTKKQEKEESGSYCQVGVVYVSQEEYEAMSYDEKKRYELQANGHWAKPLYDYPPKRLVVKEIEAKIFEQTVDTLDIKAVIKSINMEPASVATQRPASDKS